MAADDAPVDQACVEGYLFVRSPPRLLLLRRPPSRGSIWVPVSGKIEPTDAGPAAAVRREITEETDFRDLVSVEPLDWTVPFTGPDGRRWRLEAFAAELAAPSPPTLSAEHDAFEWVTFDAATVRLHYDDNRAAAERLHARLRGRSSATPVDPPPRARGAA